MTDQRTKQLLPASFKGIPFRVRTEGLTKGGRKKVLHEYPNSNVRFIEDLGLVSSDYSLTAFVHGPNFLGNARDLERALSEDGSGPLVMPTLGSVTVYALPYRKDASQQTVGEISFQLEFAVGEAQDGPEKTEAGVEDVYAAGDSAREATGAALGDKLLIPVDADSKQVEAFDMAVLAEDTVEEYRSKIPTDKIEAINARKDEIISQASDLITKPREYADAIYSGTRKALGLYNQISQAVSVVSSKDAFIQALQATAIGSQLTLSLASIKGAFLDEPAPEGTAPFSSPEILEQYSQFPTWDADTTNRDDRNTNRNTLVQAHRIGALIVAFEQAAQKTYATTDEIAETREKLELANNQVMRVDVSGIESMQSDPSVRDALSALRALTYSVLEQSASQSARTTEIQIDKPTSAFLLAYQLFSEGLRTTLDLEIAARSIRDLNPTQNAQGLVGTVKVYSL